MCTSFGLNLLSNNKALNDTVLFQNFYRDVNDKTSLSYNDVVHAYEDSKGNLWFGTFGGGVNKLVKEGNKYRFEMVNQRNGLVNDEVFGILEDNQGHIWLSTENGLSRFNSTNKTFDNFNKSNGLGETEFSENTCFQLSDGKLLFGGVHGVEIIEPAMVEIKAINSKVVLTRFLLFNKLVEVGAPNSPLKRSISYSDTIKLRYNQSSFSLEFSAMNYLDESKTQYAYILNNFDQTWNYVGSERKATYTNLKPGQYVFEVKSAQWNGKWSEDVTKLQIEILPPWWRTTYAYIAYLIVFLVASFFVTRIILRVTTVRNELRVEKAVNEVKLQFFTNVSHEIRTPLTLILGPIEDLLSDPSLGEAVRKSLLQVQKNGKRMLHLLNQLLDFRKLQNRKMTLKVSLVDINKFTSSIYDNFIEYAKHKGIEFTFHTTFKEQTVYIDPHTMDSVIFNLLSNAFKFTPRGKSIGIKLDKSENGKEIYIRIKDNGPGLCAKDIPLIFSRYSILSSESNSGKGTGIGLHLSNEIVKLHGGEIKVESTLGEGCEFSVVLKIGKTHFEGKSEILFIENPTEVPFVKTDLAELLPDIGFDTDESSEVDRSKAKPTILVVEDNPEIIQYIKEGFDGQYMVLQATNGLNGLEMAEKALPELIISDIMMPELDGIEMTRRLKSNFNTCHIPVVLLTAKTSVDDQIAGLQAGALSYVVKPFNMGILRSLVDNLVAQRKLIVSKYRDKQDIELSEVKFQSRDQEFIDNLVKHIERNYSDPQLTINSLAEFSCVSRTVFYNKVKSLTGISPVEFLRQIKLKIAAKMLEQGYNVSEAALNIGFNDTRYFSRQFRELFGESPSQYRKRHNAGADDVDE
jgi:signal transduction histidine kinase/DNA-binding response OmpR family regulator